MISRVKIVRDLNDQPKIPPYTVFNEQLRQNYRELLSSTYILRIMGIRQGIGILRIPFKNLFFNLMQLMQITTRNL